MNHANVLDKINASCFLIVCVCSLRALVHADISSEDLPCWSPLGTDRCVGDYRGPELIDIRVTEGRETDRDEIPWQVALYRQSVVNVTPNDFELFCGGSIITHQHILTAAHLYI